MPARARTNKLLKAKENVLENAKSVKNVGTTRRQRKPLADKTNSASDDNASIESKANSKPFEVNVEENMRPRRDRRLPSRFNDNQLLINLSNTSSKEESPVKKVEKPKKTTKSTEMGKKTNLKKSLNKTPADNISSENTKDNSLVVNRPRRIHKLPVKFGEQTASPIKNHRVQPCHASTPILSKVKKSQNKINDLNMNSKVLPRRNTARTQVKSSKSDLTKNSNQIKSPVKKNNPDKNNNPNAKKQSKTAAALKDKNNGKAKYNLNFSYRVLENQPTKPPEEKLAVYEFTFDPAEEPAPQKKKRKQVIRKKAEPKPKNIFVSDNYYKNLTKTLTSLKHIIATKTESKITDKSLKTVPETTEKHVKVVDKATSPTPVDENININTEFEPVVEPSPAIESEQDQFIDDMNYSPATSPAFHQGVKDSTVNETRDLGQDSVKNTELLHDNISCFDEEPVASSSMNLSVRDPNACPWRVEFNNLPIKWGTNTYVKPNMTPAVESSFVNFDSDKKHVYTNILTDNNMSEIVETNDNSNFKQTTLISFLQEVCDKKKKKSVTPSKANSNFEDSFNVSTAHVDPPVADNIVEEAPVNIKTPSKRKIDTISKEIPLKTCKDATPTIDNCFGFDECTLSDQENISPNREIKKPIKRMKTRSKVLAEINRNAAPFRANIPKAKEKLLKDCRIEELHEKLAPENVESERVIMDEHINTSDSSASEGEVMEEDRNMEIGESSPTPLFEDIQVIHHNKPNRKSYGKAKKVAFKPSVPEDTRHIDESYDEDDHTFHIPVIKVRKPVKKKPKQMRSKKEEKEAEEWAAGFNSMCEEVDGFNLVVE